MKDGLWPRNIQVEYRREVESCRISYLKAEGDVKEQGKLVQAEAQIRDTAGDILWTGDVWLRSEGSNHQADLK